MEAHFRNLKKGGESKSPQPGKSPAQAQAQAQSQSKPKFQPQPKRINLLSFSLNFLIFSFLFPLLKALFFPIARGPF